MPKDVLSIRLTRTQKRCLQLAAEREHKTASNLVKSRIRDLISGDVLDPRVLDEVIKPAIHHELIVPLAASLGIDLGGPTPGAFDAGKLLQEMVEADPGFAEYCAEGE